MDRFDHHCIWLNKCIGINNHNFFYTFIIVTLIYILELIQLVVANLDYKIDQNMLDRPLEKFIIERLKIRQYNFKHANLVIKIVMYLIITMGSLFLVPVSMLFIVHSKNFLAGKPSPDNIKKTTSKVDEDDQMSGR